MFVTKEGMLIRGVIYGKNLTKLKNILMRKYKIPSEYFEKEENRLLTTTAVVERLKHELKEKGFKLAIVTEYPTWDKLPIEVEYL